MEGNRKDIARRAKGLCRESGQRTLPEFFGTTCNLGGKPDSAIAAERPAKEAATLPEEAASDVKERLASVETASESLVECAASQLQQFDGARLTLPTTEGKDIEDEDEKATTEGSRNVGRIDANAGQQLTVFDGANPKYTTNEGVDIEDEDADGKIQESAAQRLARRTITAGSSVGGRQRECRHPGCGHGPKRDDEAQGREDQAGRGDAAWW